MGRWEPGARDRLSKAALELYGERGFEQTTVAEIAQRAGLTERTFFRYFADKREVLFDGAGLLEDGLVKAVAGAPETATPMAAAAAGLEAVAAVFPAEHRPFARERHAVIMANAGLHERELIKLANLAAAVAGALRERGVAEPAASLTAEAAVAVFKVAFTRWIADGEDAPLPELMAECLAELKAVVAAG